MYDFCLLAKMGSAVGIDEITGTEHNSSTAKMPF